MGGRGHTEAGEKEASPIGKGIAQLRAAAVRGAGRICSVKGSRAGLVEKRRMGSLNHPWEQVDKTSQADTWEKSSRRGDQQGARVGRAGVWGDSERLGRGWGR